MKKSNRGRLLFCCCKNFYFFKVNLSCFELAMQKF
nr:MAG TPA: hypothetical protein [Caudoviricetes sp.]